VRDFSYTVRLPPETTQVFVGPLDEVPLSSLAETGCLLADASAHAARGPALSAFAARLIRRPAAPIVLHAGEALKDLAAVAPVWNELLARGLDRSSLLIAAGGGSLLDACGFVAATFLRGVAFAAVPTTLLAQVDAAIGGKCGVNAGQAKNQIGVIRQPRCVAVDLAFIAALPDRAFRSGLGELAKCALLSGGELHALAIGRSAAILARDPDALERAVLLALRYKADVVSRDPLDRGERALLNAGHTVGHAIEAEALKRGVELPHGDAVAIGLAVEALACDGADPACVRRVLEAWSLPSALPFRIDPGSALALLERDKKRRGDAVTLPVVQAPGAVVLRDVPIRRLVEALAQERFS
jgi:3-dehydroquinate synthetase